MKKIALAFSILAISSIGASAADLPVKAPVPYVAPAPFSWTGFYVGGNVGAGVLLDQGFQPQNANDADRHGIGGLAGGQVGYNWQIGMLVLGIEGEGFWSGMKVTQDQFQGINPGTLFATASIRNKWDWDIAGRFGVAFDRALVYGKAGWVEGGFGWNANVFPLDVVQGSHNLDGLLIGIGLEYAFTNNWTVKFEYDYLGFPAKDVGFTALACPTCTPFTFTQSVSADKHIFKVGFNYLFNAAAPVVAKY